MIFRMYDLEFIKKNVKYVILWECWWFTHKLHECIFIVPPTIVRGARTERSHDQRFENLSLSEDINLRFDFGFEPSLTHGG